jgi:outer membrane lipoprotein-sorting protein
MIKNKRNILLLLSLLAMIGCIQNSNSDSNSQISDYTKSTESFKIDTGLVQFDTVTKNLTTNRLD